MDETIADPVVVEEVAAPVEEAVVEAVAAPEEVVAEAVSPETV